MFHSLKFPKPKDSWMLPSIPQCIHHTIPLNRGQCPANVAPALYFNTTKNILRGVFGDVNGTVSGEHVAQLAQQSVQHFSKIQKQQQQQQQQPQSKMQWHSKLANDFIKNCYPKQQQQQANFGDVSMMYSTLQPTLKSYKNSLPQFSQILEKRIQLEQQLKESDNHVNEKSLNDIIGSKYCKETLSKQNNRKDIEERMCQRVSHLSQQKMVSDKKKKTKIGINCTSNQSQSQGQGQSQSLNKKDLAKLQEYLKRIAFDPIVETERTLSDLQAKGLATGNVVNYLQQAMMAMPQISDGVRMSFLERLQQYTRHEELAEEMVDTVYKDMNLKCENPGLLTVTQLYELRSILENLMKKIKCNGELTTNEIDLLKQKFRILTHLSANRRNALIKSLFTNYSKMEGENNPIQYIQRIIDKMPDINKTIKDIFKIQCNQLTDPKEVKKLKKSTKIKDKYIRLIQNSFETNNYRDNSSSTYFDPKAIFRKECIAVDPYELAYLKEILAKHKVNWEEQVIIPGLPLPQISTLPTTQFTYKDFQYLRKFLVTLSEQSRERMLSLLLELQKKAHFTTDDIDFLYNLARQMPLDLETKAQRNLIKVLHDFGMKLFEMDPQLHYNQIAKAIYNYRNGNSKDLFAIGVKLSTMGEKYRNELLKDERITTLLAPSVLRSIRLLIDRRPFKPNTLKPSISLTKFFQSALLRGRRDTEMQVKDIVNTLRHSTKTPRANEALRQLMRRFSQMNEREIYSFFNQTVTQYLTLPGVLMDVIKAVEHDEVYLSRRHANVLHNILYNIWSEAPEINHNDINSLRVNTLAKIGKQLHPKRAEIYFKGLKMNKPSSMADFQKLTLKLAYSDAALIKTYIRNLDSLSLKSLYEHLNTMVDKESKSILQRTDSTMSELSANRSKSPNRSIINKGKMDEKTDKMKTNRRISLLKDPKDTTTTATTNVPSPLSTRGRRSKDSGRRSHTLNETPSDTESIRSYRLAIPEAKYSQIMTSISEMIRTRQKRKKAQSSSSSNKQNNNNNNNNDNISIINERGGTGKTDKSKVKKFKRFRRRISIDSTSILSEKLIEKKTINRYDDNQPTSEKNQLKNRKKQRDSDGGEIYEKSSASKATTTTTKPTTTSKIIENQKPEELTTIDMKKNTIEEHLPIDKENKNKKTKQTNVKKDFQSSDGSITIANEMMSKGKSSQPSHRKGNTLKTDNFSIDEKETKDQEKSMLLDKDKETKTTTKTNSPSVFNKQRFSGLVSTVYDQHQKNSLKLRDGNKSNPQQTQLMSMTQFSLSQLDENQSMMNPSMMNQSMMMMIDSDHSAFKKGTSRLLDENHSITQQRQSSDSERFKAYEKLKALNYGPLYKRRLFAGPEQLYWTPDHLLALFETGIHSIQRRPTYLNRKFSIPDDCLGRGNDCPAEGANNINSRSKYSTSILRPHIQTLLKTFDYWNALQNPNKDLRITSSFIPNMWRAGKLNQFNANIVQQLIQNSTQLTLTQKDTLMKSLREYNNNPRAFVNRLPKLRLAYHAPLRAPKSMKLLHPQPERHPIHDPDYLYGAAKYCPSMRRTIIEFWKPKVPEDPMIDHHHKQRGRSKTSGKKNRSV